VLVEAGLHAGDGKGFEFLSNGLHALSLLGLMEAIGCPMATDSESIDVV
jgi:hypothetical protein